MQCTCYIFLRLDQNRARAQIAGKCGVGVAKVEKCIIWGNHSSTQFPDAFHATVDGKPVPEVSTWVLPDTVSRVLDKNQLFAGCRRRLAEGDFHPHRSETRSSCHRSQEAVIRHVSCQGGVRPYEGLVPGTRVYYFTPQITTLNEHDNLKCDCCCCRVPISGCQWVWHQTVATEPPKTSCSASHALARKENGVSCR